MSRTHHHAHKSPAPHKGRTCYSCGLPLRGYWQRKFCDNACKQFAYRERKRQENDRKSKHQRADLKAPPRSVRNALPRLPTAQEIWDGLNWQPVVSALTKRKKR